MRRQARGNGEKNPIGRDGRVTTCNARNSNSHWFADCSEPNKAKLARKRRRKLEHVARKRPSADSDLALASFLTQFEGAHLHNSDDGDADMHGSANAGDGTDDSSSDVTDDKPAVEASGSSHFGEGVPETFRATFHEQLRLRDERALLGPAPRSNASGFYSRRRK
jgi:hypothetical protein